MEAIHGRKSALHNYIAGGIVGYVGVKRKLLSPLMDDYTIYRTGLKRAQVAFLMYGGLSGAIATIGGKPW